LSQPWLTWLICYLKYKIEITQEKKNGTNDEANGLITKYQMMTLKKNQFLIKDPKKKAELKSGPVMRLRLPCWKAITKKITK
jgi:hypothetical protein